MDVGGPCPWSLLPLRRSVKNDAETGMLPTGFFAFGIPGEPGRRETYGVEWLPRRISSDRPLEVFEGASEGTFEGTFEGVLGGTVDRSLLRPTGRGVCGGLGSPSRDSSSDSESDESRSSMALGWFWMLSKKEGGVEGAGADLIDGATFVRGISRTNCLVPLRSEMGNGGVVDPGSYNSSGVSDNTGPDMGRDGGIREDEARRCAKEDDRGGGERGVMCANEDETLGGGDAMLSRGTGLGDDAYCSRLCRREDVRGGGLSTGWPIASWNADVVGEA